MLNLVLCEFTKLKRKKIVLLIILSAFLFPVPLTAFMTLPFPIESEAVNFNEYFSYVMGYGVELLLPCVIGITAANLFFMERDHDTFKNLRVIPVTSTQMVLAKIIVLFLFGILFSLASAVAAFLCGGFTPGVEVTGIFYKLVLALEMGAFITGGTLPLVVLGLLGSLINAMVCMLYVAKTRALGAYTLLGLIIGLLMVATGHACVTPILSTVLGALADIITRKIGRAHV